MVKGIDNAFDHLKFCLVLNLTTKLSVQVASGLLYGHQFLILGALTSNRFIERVGWLVGWLFWV